MSQINLQFSAEDTAESKWIRWFTAGAYSHVDRLMGDGKLLGARLEGGVQIRAADYAAFSAKRIVSIPASEEEAVAFRDFCAAQIGKPYDETAIWGFVLDRDWHNAEAWFCSELMAAALEAAKLMRPTGPEVWRVTPAMLFAVTEQL